MNRRLFVGNLPASTTAEDLRRLFSARGTVVAARVIPEGRTGASRGFGFVRMATEEEARAAAGLDRSPWEGRELVVQAARHTPHPASPRRPTGAKGLAP